MLISLAQIEITKNDSKANLAKAEEFIKEAARRGSDIIQFPEMWTTGFDFKFIRSAATQQGETINTIASFAKQYKIWITGSLLNCDKNGKPINCSLLFDHHGHIVCQYNKVHLFSMVQEDHYLTPGDHLSLYEFPWGIGGFSICYDIRFPELFRTYALQGAKFIFSPMAFPYPRIEHWKVLVKARAIENQLFMISTNQVGQAHLNPDPAIKYFGHSSIIDPWGQIIIDSGDEEILLTAAIDLTQVDKVRNSMHVFADRKPNLYELG